MDPASPSTAARKRTAQAAGSVPAIEHFGRGWHGTSLSSRIARTGRIPKACCAQVVESSQVEPESDAYSTRIGERSAIGGLLKHPNIVDIYELGEHNGAVFIAMELVSGLSLRTLLKSRNELPLSVMLQLSLGIASGLDRAHAFQIDGRRAGLVHRDLKPSNILVSWNAEVKIADFGIAVTQLHQPTPEMTAHAAKRAAGTPAYMSPEQSQGRPLDARSDLFSFGLVIFEMAIGRRLLSSRELAQRLPKAVKDKQSILKAQEEQFLNNVLPDLGTLVARCLQPLPGLRYPSARAVEIALEKLQQQAIPGPKLRVWLKAAYPDLSDQLGTLSAPYSTLSDEGLITSDTLLSPLEARSNLGPNMDDFIGRDSELELLSRKVHDGARLITLKGTGGGGKTLTEPTFRPSKPSVFASGAWFVDLTECRTALSIVHALSRALDIPLATDWELDELVQRTGHALAARGSILLILDNFEQITSHAQTTLARWLQQRLRRCFWSPPENVFDFAANTSLNSHRCPIVMRCNSSIEELPPSVRNGTTQLRTKKPSNTWFKSWMVFHWPSSLQPPAVDTFLPNSCKYESTNDSNYSAVRMPRMIRAKPLCGDSFTGLGPYCNHGNNQHWLSCPYSEVGFHWESAEAVLDSDDWPRHPGCSMSSANYWTSPCWFRERSTVNHGFICT